VTRGNPDPDNYPAQLQRFLDARPGPHYRVLNLGVPGLTTTQLLSRFGRWLDYYRPAAVVHWAGINDSWHHADEPWEGGLLARAAQRSEVLHLARRTLVVGRQPWTLEGAGIEVWAWRGAFAVWRVDFGGVDEIVWTGSGRQLPIQEVEAIARADIDAMARLAVARGIPMHLVTYPFVEGRFPLIGAYFEAVNRAIASAAIATGSSLVDGSDALAKLGRDAPGEDPFDQTGHPRPALYQRVAAEVAATLGSPRPVE
jgi:lysophospholipase L1-like esterase